MISTNGAAETRRNVGWFERNVLFGFVLAHEVADKEAMERALAETELDWTVVRVGVLTNGPATGRIRAADNGSIHQMGKVGRADVAAFMVAQLESDEWKRRKPVLVGNGACTAALSTPGVHLPVGLAVRLAAWQPKPAFWNVKTNGEGQTLLAALRSERQNIPLWRRDDGHALRGSAEHAAFEEVVMRSKAWAMQIARRRGMKKAIGRWRADWPWFCTAYGLTAPSSGGPGKPIWHERPEAIKPDRRKSSFLC